MSHEETSTPTAAEGALGRERAAGLILVLFGLIAFWAGWDLPFSSESGVGSGLVPRLLSLIIVGLGVAQVVVTWRNPGPTMGRWPVREMIPVILGVVLFAVTIRGYAVGPFTIPALGLAVASPLAIICSGFAAKDVRIGELLVFAAVLTAFCIGLFRFALGLSIPVAPWLIGY